MRNGEGPKSAMRKAERRDGFRLTLRLPHWRVPALNSSGIEAAYLDLTLSCSNCISSEPGLPSFGSFPRSAMVKRSTWARRLFLGRSRIQISSNRGKVYPVWLSATN